MFLIKLSCDRAKARRLILMKENCRSRRWRGGDPAETPRDQVQEVALLFCFSHLVFSVLAARRTVMVVSGRRDTHAGDSVTNGFNELSGVATLQDEEGDGRAAGRCGVKSAREETNAE